MSVNEQASTPETEEAPGTTEGTYQEVEQESSEESREESREESSPGQSNTVGEVDAQGVVLGAWGYADGRKVKDGSRFKQRIGQAYPWPEGKEPEKVKKDRLRREAKKAGTKAPAGGHEASKVVIVPPEEKKPEKKLTKAEQAAAFEKQCKDAAEDYKITAEACTQLFTGIEAGTMEEPEERRIVSTAERAASRNEGKLPSFPPWLSLLAFTGQYVKRAASTEKGQAELEKVKGYFSGFLGKCWQVMKPWWPKT